MSSFGKFRWGLRSWGVASPPTVTATPEPPVFGEPDDGHAFGTPGGRGTSLPDVYSLTQLEVHLKEGGGSGAVTVSHIRAFVATNMNDPRSGPGEAADTVLKAKSWLNIPDAISHDFQPGGPQDLPVLIGIAGQGIADLNSYILAFGAKTSTFEDIGAQIQGLFETDIYAFIRGGYTDVADLPTAIHGFIIRDLPAELYPLILFDLDASIASIPPEDLPAAMTPVPPKDLPTSILSIPGFDLGAIGGGHFPEDIPAYLAAVLPENLPAYIKGGLSDTLDLGASLIQAGQIEHLGGFIKTLLPSSANLGGVLRVIAKGFSDIGGRVHGFVTTDLPAIIQTQRVLDMRSIIIAICTAAEFNLPAVIRRSDAGTLELPVTTFKNVVSTHTSDKLFNLTKVPNIFYENRYAFGTHRAGLVFLNIEPIFGFFPDLHAEIFARDFARDNLGAFVRAAIPTYRDLPTRLVSVVPFANVSRLTVSLIPLLNLYSELVQVGGFLRLRGSLTPVHSAATTTAADAGFVTTASDYRFYLGTSGGLFIPTLPIPQIRVTSYKNNTALPDLHATLAGWHQTDLSASISEYPFSPFPASLNALDLSHLSNLSAYARPAHPMDLGASLTRSGGLSDLVTELIVQGQISDLGGTLVALVNPLAFNVVSVSTMPVSDMGALINYDTFVRCSPTSVVTGITAFLKPIVTGRVENVSNLPTSLNALRIVENLGAAIVSRKRTRVRVLSLDFRSKIRDSERIRGSITPVTPAFWDIAAEIRGLLHEADLLTSIVPIRFAPPTVDFKMFEKVANFDDGTLKDVMLTFKSQVSNYVYEDISNSVYATDQGTWAVDLRTLARTGQFFDRDEGNRDLTLTDMSEHYSFDEAVRAALVILCERRQFNLTAELEARGTIIDIGVLIGITSADKMSNMSAKIAAMLASPDITASVNTGDVRSQLDAVMATIIPRVETQGNLNGFLFGNIIDDLAAEIIPV